VVGFVTSGAVLAVVGVVALVVGAATPTGADPAAWVRSNFETTFGMKVARDCGFSEPLPGHPGESLWIFCDTGVYDPAGTLVNYFAGSSAARGTPAGVSELPTPAAPLPDLPWAGAPAPFVPAPAGLVRKDGLPCSGNGPMPASWITGLTGLPGTGRLLLTFVDVCIEGAWDWTPQSFGMVEYDPATNTLSPTTTVFAERSGRPLTQQLHLGSPVVADDGYLYLYSHSCDTWYVGSCAMGRVVVARVPVEQRSDPAAYRYFGGLGWTDKVAFAANVLLGGRPMSISVDTGGAAGAGFVLVEGTSVGGTYRVWEATAPTGPWLLRTPEELRLPGCTAPAGVVDFCHALTVQPDLSTPDRVAVSHYAVADQHVRVTTTPLRPAA
jgi:hypothetical protein